MPLLQTNVDKLLDFVRVRKGCTVDDAAKALTLPHKKVEQIAETLHEIGLIKIRFGLTGIRLIPLQNGDNGIKIAGALNGPAAPIPSIVRIDAIRQELAQAENLFVFSEREIKKKMEGAKTHFIELERLEFTQDTAKISKGKMKDMEASLRALEERVNSLGRATMDIRQHMGGLEGKLEFSANNNSNNGNGLKKSNGNKYGLIERLFSN